MDNLEKISQHLETRFSDNYELIYYVNSEYLGYLINDDDSGLTEQEIDDINYWYEVEFMGMYGHLATIDSDDHLTYGHCEISGQSATLVKVTFVEMDI